jgi:hypothetical protein
MILLFALFGCGVPDPELVAAGVAAADQAVGVSLVVAELLDQVDAEPLRHDGCGTCPCVERLGTADFYTLLADYAAEPGPLVDQNAGCVPTSGLVPAELRGHVWLDVIDGTVSTIRSEQATLDGRDLQPWLDADWRQEGDGWSADVGCDLQVGSLAASLGVDVVRSGDRLVLDGLVDAAGTRVELVGVELGPEDLGDCPMPSAGIAHVRAPGRIDVRFLPGGVVEVGHGGRTVQVEPCASTEGFLR